MIRSLTMFFLCFFISISSAFAPLSYVSLLSSTFLSVSSKRSSGLLLSFFPLPSSFSSSFYSFPFPMVAILSKRLSDVVNPCSRFTPSNSLTLFLNLILPVEDHIVFFSSLSTFRDIVFLARTIFSKVC